MQSDNFVFLQILRLGASELWKVNNRRGTCKSKGHAQILYSKSLNTFLLKFNDLFFTLDKSLQTTGTYSEKGKWHLFTIPTFAGFYILKVLDSQPGPVMSNFESILQNTTNYSQKSDLEEPLSLYCAEDIQNIETNESKPKGGFAKLSDAFSKILAPTAESDSHPNQKIVRNFSELLDVDSPGVPMVDVSSAQLQNSKQEVEEVIRNHQGDSYWIDLKGEERSVPSNLRGISGTATLPSMTHSKEESHHHKLPSLHHDHPEGEHHHLPHLLHHHHGADNIKTCVHKTGQDNQEIVGLENQRLPQYEIEGSRDLLLKGFRKASSHFDELPTTSAPATTSTATSLLEESEDTSFTTGLLSGANERTYSDLSKDNLKFQKWGSNITNASETPARDDSMTDLGYPLGKPQYFGNPHLTSENLEKLPKTQPAQPLQPTTAAFADKTNAGVQQTKESTKHKAAKTQEVDKENVGGSYVV